MSIVPVSALFMKDGQSFVWLYNEQDETIEPVSVAVERLTKDGEAIVRSALRKGQTVISAGVNDLKEGQKVKLLPPVRLRLLEGCCNVNRNVGLSGPV